MAGRLPATTATRMLPSLLAVIAVDFDVSIVTIGSFLAIARLAGLAAPFAGWLVARFGSRKVLLASLDGFCAIATGLAVASRIWVFGPLLVGLAIVSMGYEASATAQIYQMAPAESRTRYLGRLDLGWSIGLLIGVPIATVLAVASWRFAYVATAVLAGLALIRLLGAGGDIGPGGLVKGKRENRASWFDIARKSWPVFAAFGLPLHRSSGQRSCRYCRTGVLAISATALAFGSTRLAVGVGTLALLLAGHDGEHQRGSWSAGLGPLRQPSKIRAGFRAAR